MKTIAVTLFLFGAVGFNNGAYTAHTVKYFDFII